MRVTIKQVAMEAGVSRGAVDKVIHNRPGISEKVRQRVQDTIKRLGYTPNKAARALLSSRHETIFAIIMPKLDNPFFANIKKGMDKAVQNLGLMDYGVKLEFYYCEAFHIDEFCSILTYLLHKNIQGLIIRGVQNNIIEKLLLKFTDKAIPVITYDSDMPNINRLCFIGENNLKSGRIAASLMVKSITQNGKVAVFSGSENMLAHKLRVQGFIDYIAENAPNIEIIDTLYTHEQSVIATNLISTLINQYSDLRGIFNTAGCSEIIAEKVYESKKDIRLITYNFSPKIIDYVKKKTIDYTIGLSPHKQGYLSIQTLFNYVLFKEKTSSDVINVQIDIGLDENIELLHQNEFDTL